MKSILFLLLSIQTSFTLFSQVSVDPGLDGRSIDHFKFEDDYKITFDTAEAVTMVNPRGINGLVVTVDVRDGKRINSITDNKGIFLKASDEKGNFLVQRAGGAVVNPFGKVKDDYKVIVPESKEVGIFEIVDKTAYDSDRSLKYFVNGNYLIIGPKDRGFKLFQKNKFDDPVIWLINRYNIDDMIKYESTFSPKGLDGRQDETGYVLLDVKDESFTILSKTFSEKDIRESKEQDIMISEFDFQGNLIGETSFNISINNSKYKFARAPLKAGNVIKWSNGKTYPVPTAAATGTVYYNKIDDTFLVCAILEGISKEFNAVALLSKRDIDGNEIWSEFVNIFGVRPSKYDIEDTGFYPIIAGNKIFYRKTDYSSRNEEGVIVGVLDYSTGELIQNSYFDKLKGITEVNDSNDDFLYGRNIKGEFSDNIVLDPDAILAYATIDSVKKFFKAENPTSLIWYYANINNDASVSILKADYKNKVYRLYYLE